MRLTVFAVLLFTSLASFAQTKPHRFFGKTNIVLFSLDASVRIADAYTTRQALGPYGHDLNQPDWISHHAATEYGYSLGTSALVMGIAYLAHRTHHHRIERLIPVADILYDGQAVVNNFEVNSHPGVADMPAKIVGQ